MPYDPTLLPMAGHQMTSPSMSPPPMPQSGAYSPTNGVASMVKALVDGRKEYGKRMGMGGMGQVPTSQAGAPLSLAPPMDPTDPTNPAKMTGGLGQIPVSQIGMLRGPTSVAQPMAPPVNPATVPGAGGQDAAGMTPMPTGLSSQNVTAPMAGPAPTSPFMSSGAQQPPTNLDPVAAALASPQVGTGGAFSGQPSPMSGGWTGGGYGG